MGRFSRHSVCALAGLWGRTPCSVKVEGPPLLPFPSLSTTSSLPDNEAKTTSTERVHTVFILYHIVEKSCLRRSLSSKHPLGVCDPMSRIPPSRPRSTSISIRLSTISPLSTARKHPALPSAIEIAPDRNNRNILQSIVIEGVLLTTLLLVHHFTLQLDPSLSLLPETHLFHS